MTKKLSLGPERDALLLRQEGIEIRNHLWRVPPLLANNFPSNFPASVDDIGFRIDRSAIIQRNLRRSSLYGRISPGRKRDSVLDQEFLVRIGVLVHITTQNQPTLRLDMTLQDIQVRRLRDTWRAPARPEIQYHDFPAIIGKLHRPSTHLHRKIFRCFSCKRGFALPVMRHCKGNQDENAEQKWSPNLQF